MLQRDYLLREAERFARAMSEVLASIIGARKGGIPVEQLFEVADQELANRTDIQLREVLDASPEDILHLLTNQMKLQPLHLEHLSDILVELADIARSSSTPVSEKENPLELLKKAQIILEHATHADTLYSMERASKLDQLTHTLSQHGKEGETPTG